MAPLAPDWDYLESLDPNNLKDEEVDKIYPQLSRWKPGQDEEEENLVTAFLLAAALAKWRTEELEEALDQMEGQEVLEEENKKLKAQIKKIKKDASKGSTDVDVEELLEVERELEKVNKAFQDQGTELETIRTEKEQLESRVEDLEKDKKRLKRDIQSLEAEVQDTRAAAEDMAKPDDEEVDTKRLKELEDTVRVKNKQIHQLLEDIEQVEKDNEVFQEKVKDLRDELAEATRQISTMTGEYISMKDSLNNSQNLVDTLQQDNQLIKTKLEDQYKEKRRRDQQIEKISCEVDIKIDEMKKICQYKDAQIEELRSRLNRAVLTSDTKAGTEADRQNLAVLTKAIKERDEQIESLQKELAEASRELESSALIVEELKGSSKKQGGISPVQKSLLQVRSQLHEAKEKIIDLKEDLNEAEESAKDKAEELSDAITKLRMYEAGEYGLEEAVHEVQQLKKSTKLKDKQIEELMQQANTFQYENGELREENDELREKLGMDLNRSDSQRSSSSKRIPKASIQKQQDRALMQVMQREVERLEEERIQLKTDNRKLAQQLGHRAAKLGLDADDLQAIQEYTDALKNRRTGMTGIDNGDPIQVIKMHEGSVLMQKDLETQLKENELLKEEVMKHKSKYDDIFEENDKLRQGMQEILDSIREQDGKSDVAISSPILEKLIAILDARHYYGEYKPAMGLKSRIQKIEGINTELREQLRRVRLEEDKASGQAQRLRGKLQQVENELNAIKQGNITVPNQVAATITTAATLPAQISASANENIAKLNTQLIQVLDELDAKEKQCHQLQKENETFSKKYSVTKHQVGLLYEEYQSSSETFREEKKILETEKDELVTTHAGCEAKILEYELYMKELKNGDEAIMKKVSETTRRIAILKSNEVIISRKFKSLEEREKHLVEECRSLKSELVQLENQMISTVGDLQRQKEKSNYKIEALQKALGESVPLKLLENANSQYNDITAKYRDILQKQETQSNQTRTIEDLELEVQSLKQEKETLNMELVMSKEKVYSLESIVSSLGVGDDDQKPNENQHEIDKLSKQVATLEVKELNERQKSDYLNNQYKLSQSQIQHYEKRQKELEDKFDMITKTNLELQRIERELRDQLITSIPKEQFDEINTKLKEMQETEVLIKIENKKLKEVADVAQNQILAIEHQTENSYIEIEALRHQALDLQTQTDEKALIGRLHEQVVSLQMKENDLKQKIKSTELKLSKAESNILRANRKTDEMEQLAIKIRSQSNVKIRSLFTVIQELRRQYSGSIPLLKQEKLSQSIIEINLQKQKVSQLLREAELKLQEMESKREEMEIKQKGVDEIMATLQHGNGMQHVLEWHSKLEDLRLKELRSRRNAEQWEKEVLHLREVKQKQEQRLQQSEEEMVRIESLMEHKQLEWETREVELEKLELKRQKTLTDEGRPEDSEMFPNPDLPLAKQLEIALRNSKQLSNSLEEYKIKVSDSKKIYEDLNRRCRDAESQVLIKDKLINDLRSQIPASVDRATAVTSVIGQPGIPIVLTEDYENRQSLKIAQTTVDSLRQRLKQKEETMSRYEELLKQMNDEHEEGMKKRQEENFILQKTIRAQQTAFNELRASRKAEEELITTGSTINQHITRIQELEDEVQQMQNTIGQLSSQLSAARLESDKLLNLSNARLQEINDMKDNAQVEGQMKTHQQKQEIDRLNSEIRTHQQENILLKEDIERMQEAQSKAPSTVLKSLVDKLKNDLAEKDKKQRAMGRAIAELKNEMLAAAEEGIKSADAQKSNQNVQRLIDRETKSLQTKIDEQTMLIEKLRNHLKIAKEAESKASTSVLQAKEELNKKSNIILKLKEDKLSGSRPDSRVRFRKDTEKEDLQKQIEVLEEKVRKMNKAEKPFEDEDESKVIKNAEELARWDEKKKWQKKVEELKDKLKDADKEVSKLSKLNDSLRETVSRLDREKVMIDQKWKNSLKLNSAKSTMTDGKMAALQKENIELKSKVADLEHKETMKQDSSVETLKLRVKFLQERIIIQEKKISTMELGKKGNTAVAKEVDVLRKKETKLEKEKQKLDESNVQLKFKLETFQHNILKINEEVKKLTESVNVIQDSQVLPLAGKLKNLTQIIKDMIGHQLEATDTSTVERAPSMIFLEPSKQFENETGNMSIVNMEIQKLKESNKNLLENLETKERKITELQLMLRDTKKPSGKGPTEMEDEQQSDLTTKIRKMEVDLKRKSDLLSEVKVLLRQAADRERSQENEKETLRRQLKSILEIDPKTPGESLAKDLRQTKLTVDRLLCEKKELEYQLSIVQE